jgi:hypothetical protein
MLKRLIGFFTPNSKAASIYFGVLPDTTFSPRRLRRVGQKTRKQATKTDNE